MLPEIDPIERGCPRLALRLHFVGEKPPGELGDGNCATRLGDLGGWVRTAGDCAEQLAGPVARLRRGHRPVPPDCVVFLRAAPACPLGTVSDDE